MSETTKKGLVPTLRFPEFRDAGEWEAEILGNKTIKVGSGITPNGGDKNYKTIGRPFVRSQNIGWGRLLLEDVVYIDDATHSTFLATEIAEGDVLLNITGASIGRCAVADRSIKGGNVNQHVCIIRTKADKLTPFFLNQFLLSQNGQSQIDSFQAGGNRQGLNFAQIRSFSIPLPPKTDEQQKIADCLTSIDELVAAQTQKVEALKAHKKGLMQQLFPAEGETIPKLRFPDFRGAGEWVSEELSSCLEKVIDYRGKAPPKSESGVPLITAKNVRFGWLDMSCDEYIVADEYEDWMSKGIPKAGDILFTTEAPLANVAFFPITGKFALGQRIITLRTKTKKCLSEFLFQSLLGSRMQNEIDFHSTGSTAKGIKSATFVSLKFCYPEISEQQKIADCLSSIDNLITAQAKKLEALKDHKKGLMQQLFPIVDE